MLISNSKQKEVYNYLLNDINYEINDISIELLNDKIKYIAGKVETLKSLQCYRDQDLQEIRNKTKTKLIEVYKNEIENLTVLPEFTNDPDFNFNCYYF